VHRRNAHPAGEHNVGDVQAAGDGMRPSHEYGTSENAGECLEEMQNTQAWIRISVSIQHRIAA